MYPSAVDRVVLIRLLVAALAAAGLRYFLWRAILFVEPDTLRIEADSPPLKWNGEDWGLVPEPLRKASQELLGLGFIPLGTHIERAILGPTRTCFDYVHHESSSHATLFEGAGGQPHAYLLTALANGGFVHSASYRRPAREVAGLYLSGYLEEASVERVVRAHWRRLDGLEPTLSPTLEGRVAAQQAWYARFGRPEVRQRHARGLLWSVGSLGMVAWALWGIL